MCGIAGYIHTDKTPASHAVVTRMLKAIAHRGPDDKGVWVDDNLALGHARLAIIDLSDGGRQPMQIAGGRYTITYNGEIYNYLTLKTELRALGHHFVSESDTEVVLAAVLHWGLETAIAKFNGMFAFALWDAEEKVLHLARDRFGVKPLYWVWQDNTLVFGSEIKALIAYPGIEARLNPDGLREYLTFQNFHSPQTLFAGVEMLPAGSLLSLGPRQKTRPTPRRYYQLTFQSEVPNRPYDAYREELLHLFQQAVERQLVSDVDVAAYLSGGIDSGAIVSVAAHATERLRTFTCGFDLSSATGLEVFFDERREAELMSAVFGTEQYEIILKAGDMERFFPPLVRALEEPRVGQSYPNFAIAQLTAKFNKVVLAGTGGDELFGGYPWRYAQSIGADAAETWENTFAYWHRLMPEAEVARALAPIASDLTGPSPRDIFDTMFPQLAPDAPPAACLDAIMSYEARTFLPGLLTMEDKVCMAHGLEGRVPFLDNDLVDFARRLPLEFKLDLDYLMSRGEAADNGPAVGKKILRDAVSELVPERIAQARKQGFSAPDASWFRGASLDFVRSRLLDPKARIYEVLDVDPIHDVLKEHFAGHQNHRLLIWSLLHVEEAFGAWSLV